MGVKVYIRFEEQKRVKITWKTIKIKEYGFQTPVKKHVVSIIKKQIVKTKLPSSHLEIYFDYVCINGNHF